MIKTFRAYFGEEQMSNFFFDAMTCMYYSTSAVNPKLLDGVRRYKVQEGKVDIVVDGVSKPNSPSRVVISGDEKNIEREVSRIGAAFRIRLQEVVV